MWKLFIDDVRMPKGSSYIIARNSYDAIWMIDNYGIPSEIAFDHDLGGSDTAMEVVKHLEYLIYDCCYHLPFGFAYSVHSQNPVGKKNIIQAMDRLLEHEFPDFKFVL